jgi:hypothetical protein
MIYHNDDGVEKYHMGSKVVQSGTIITRRLVNIPVALLDLGFVRVF